MSLAAVTLFCFKRFCFETAFRQEHNVLYTEGKVIYCLQCEYKFCQNDPIRLYDVINIPDIRFSI